MLNDKLMKVSVNAMKMIKLYLKYNPINSQGLLGYGLLLTLLSFAVAACVEQFARLILLLG